MSAMPNVLDAEALLGTITRRITGALRPNVVVIGRTGTKQRAGHAWHPLDAYQRAYVGLSRLLEQN